MTCPVYIKHEISLAVLPPTAHATLCVQQTRKCLWRVVECCAHRLMQKILFESWPMEACNGHIIHD